MFKITTLNEPYDYASLLHYGPTAFSVNGQPTIIALQEEFNDVMGQRSEFTSIDLNKLRKLYECGEYTFLCRTCMRVKRRA